MCLCLCAMCVSSTIEAFLFVYYLFYFYKFEVFLFSSLVEASMNVTIGVVLNMIMMFKMTCGDIILKNISICLLGEDLSLIEEIESKSCYVEI